MKGCSIHLVLAWSLYHVSSELPEDAKRGVRSAVGGSHGEVLPDRDEARRADRAVRHPKGQERQGDQVPRRELQQA